MEKIQWEYKQESLHVAVLVHKLNELGREGWEMISIDEKDAFFYRKAIFKRIKR